MIVIVMGVSGSGKSTVGRALAERLGWRFYDGDDFHSPENVAKMSRGTPLTDEDRAGWLATLAEVLRRSVVEGQSVVLACSALKQRYRDQLTVDAAHTRFVYLRGNYAELLDRLRHRTHHFMKPEMLDSQLATLEEPHAALIIDISEAPETAIDHIMSALATPASDSRRNDSR